jgi:hypothetical protein
MPASINGIGTVERRMVRLGGGDAPVLVLHGATGVVDFGGVSFMSAEVACAADGFRVVGI